MGRKLTAGRIKKPMLTTIEARNKPARPRGRVARPGAEEQERAAQALRESEGKFRDLAEKSPVGIYLIQGHLFRYVNPRLAEIFGYTTEEMVDRLGPDALLLPEDRGAVDRTIADGKADKMDSIHFEFRGVTKTKEVIDAEVYGSRTVYKGRTAIIGTLLDVTARRHAEDSLRLLNEFNAAIIDNAPVAIFTLDRNGVFTSVNPALATLSGLGPKAETKLIGFQWLKNPYTIKCGLASLIEKALQGESFQLWDFPYMTYKGDRNLYMDFKGVPLKGKDGSIEGLLCIIEETTDRVKTRAKLMQETRMSAIGRLAAGIAHELNNPLATLVAHSELAGHCLESLETTMGKTSEMADLKAYLDIIEAQVFRCKNVTSDILSLPWREGLEITEIDVNRVLRNILEFMATDKSKVRIIAELDGSVPPVRGDIGALRQVFTNLISNALDAVEGRMEPTIWIRSKAVNDKVEVEVEDNGIGIPDSIIDKIFEPFFTTKESKKGIGLGLSLCHEFLSNMGGTIRTESKPRYGTTFFVALPTKDQEKAGGKYLQ
jgi:two-component system, cell cycle sensor histidine kinase and response regulator CckA